MINFESHCLYKHLHEADLNSSWLHIPAFYLRSTQILETISYMNSHEITNQMLFKTYHRSTKQVVQGHIQYTLSHTSQDKNTAVYVLYMFIWGNIHTANKMGDIHYFPN